MEPLELDRKYRLQRESILSPLVALPTHIAQELLNERELDLGSNDQDDARRHFVLVADLSAQAVGRLSNRKAFLASQLLETTKDGDGFSAEDEAIPIASGEVSLQHVAEHVNTEPHGPLREPEKACHFV